MTLLSAYFRFPVSVSQFLWETDPSIVLPCPSAANVAAILSTRRLIVMVHLENEPGNFRRNNKPGSISMLGMEISCWKFMLRYGNFRKVHRNCQYSNMNGPNIRSDETIHLRAKGPWWAEPKGQMCTPPKFNGWFFWKWWFPSSESSFSTWKNFSWKSLFKIWSVWNPPKDFCQLRSTKKLRFWLSFLKILRWRYTLRILTPQKWLFWGPGPLL